MSQEAPASQVSLCDALDRILAKGVVVNGDILISVAGVDLLYIGLRGLICAVDAMEQPPASLQRAANPAPANSDKTEYSTKETSWNM